jgi:hypothetical protein
MMNPAVKQVHYSIYLYWCSPPVAITFLRFTIHLFIGVAAGFRGFGYQQRLCLTQDLS